MVGSESRRRRGYDVDDPQTREIRTRVASPRPCILDDAGRFLRGNASALGNPDEFIPRATKRNGGAGQADTDCYWSSTYLEVKPPGGYHHHHKQRKFKYGLSSNTS